MLSFIYFNGGSEFIHNNESRIFFLQVHLFFLGLAVEGPVLFVKGSSFFRFFNGGPEFIHNYESHLFLYRSSCFFLFGSKGSCFFKAPLFSFIYFNRGPEFIHHYESRIYFYRSSCFLRFGSGGSSFFVFVFKGSIFF